jgi:hypothetical protein
MGEQLMHHIGILNGIVSPNPSKIVNAAGPAATADPARVTPAKVVTTASPKKPPKLPIKVNDAAAATPNAAIKASMSPLITIEQKVKPIKVHHFLL